MAEGTAAPNAGAPAAQPTSGTAEVAAPVESVAAPQARAIKPIASKPILSLPGVIPDEDDGLFPTPPPRSSSAAPPPGSLTADSSSPSRGPDGRFLAGHAGQQGNEPDESAAPIPAAVPEKYKWAGEEFDSQEAAEQNFKSLRGQFKPLAAKAAKAAEHEAQLVLAAKSARAWKAEHDRVVAEHAKPAVAEKAAEAPEDVDWGLYSEIKRIATESNEPWKAEQWLIGEVRRIESGRTQKLIDEALLPSRTADARKAVESQTTEVFGALADLVNADGSSYFPELQDETTAYEVGETWTRMGLPSEFALTPQGAAAAIGLYRLLHGSQGKSNGVIKAAPLAAPAVPAGPSLAEGLAEGRGSAVGSIADAAPGMSPEAARILHGLKQAHKQSEGRSLLGFDA
jgi:hypothetical protein